MPGLSTLPPVGGMAREAERARSHHGHVMHDLGIGIVGARYPENSILPGDAELTARFGVSRTVLREALKTLAAKGLIQARAKIGTRVRERRFWNLFDPEILRWHAETGVKPGFLFSLGEMRLALEPEAAALAALRRTAGHLDELEAALALMAAAKGSDFVDGDLRFHLAVAEASGNPFMRSASALIEVALAITFTVSSPIPDAERQAVTVARHRTIAEAIARGDAEAARAAMGAVIREGMERAGSVVGVGSASSCI